MGLLGNGWDDPQSQAIMALSAGLLSNNGAQGLGAGLLGANQAVAQARQDAIKNQIAQMNLQRGGMEMDEMRRKIADEAATRGVLQQFYQARGNPASPPIGGAPVGPVMGGAPPTAEGAAPPQAQTGGGVTPKAEIWKQYSQIGDMLSSKGLIDKAQTYYGLAEKLRPKYSTTPQVVKDPNTGKLINVLVGEDGTIQPMQYGVKPDMVLENLGGTVRAIDKNDTPGGAEFTRTQSPDSIANAAATREVAAATRDAARINSNQNTEMKLGDDYRAQSKNFKETADAYKQISAVLDKATTSPAATLAGATKFMKMIDPGSVVRESELGMALAATGVFDRASNYFNTLQNGKVLTPSQVVDFKNITKQINDAAAQQQRLVDNHFSNVAKGYGLRPEMVVQDYGQSGAAAPGAGWTITPVR